MPSLYDRDILRLAADIPHLGRLPAPQGSAERRSVVCGSRIVVDVVLDDAGRIAELGQEVRACALGQASAAIMSGHAVGRSGDELARARDALAGFFDGQREGPGDWPEIGLVARARDYPARHPSIMLAFEAVTEAVAIASGERRRRGCQP